jgi:dTMP kinase
MLGILITFEGGEGCGKTTQLELLSRRLETDLGRHIQVEHEFNDSNLSSRVRSLLVDQQNQTMSLGAELFLFQAIRTQAYEERILPALQTGKVVLTERSRDSGVVYQGIMRGFGIVLVEQLNDISTKETKPNLTFLLDLPVEVGLKRRVDSGKMDRLDMEKTDFHDKVRSAYLNLAKQDQSGRWHVIDANRDIDAIAEDIWTITKTFLADQSE